MNQFKFYAWLCISELWDKRWLFLPLFWLLSFFAITVVFLIPDQYKTRAGIYIDTDKLLAQVLKDTTFALDQSAEAQAQKVSQMIYTTSNLRKVLRSVSDENYDLSPTEEAIKLEKMRENLTFGTMGGKQKQSTVKDYYEITYVDKDPLIAYNTLKQILDLFIETNIRQMSSKNDRALAVSEDTLKARQRELSEAQADIAKFKQENVKLTETSAVLLGELQRMQEIVRTYASQRNLLDAKLTNTTALLTQTPRKTGSVQTLDPNCDFNEIEKELSSAKARGLTELHPDVSYYNDLLQRKKQSCKASGGNVSSDGNVNPAYLQLSEQLTSIKGQISELEVDYKNAKKRISEIEDLLNQRPVAMEKLRILETRLKKASDSLRDATTNNDILQGTIDLSRKSGLISYEVIEEVQMPILPEKPNRLLLFVGAFLASLIGAASFILMRFKMERRMVSINHLREAFDLPVLGSITLVDNQETKIDVFDAVSWVVGLLLLIIVYLVIVKIVIFSGEKFDFFGLSTLINNLLQLFI